MIPKNKIKLTREQETPLMKIVREKLQTKNVERAIIPSFTLNYQNFANGMMIDLLTDGDNIEFCSQLSILLEEFDMTPEEVKEFEENGCLYDKIVLGIRHEPEIVESCKQHFEELFRDPIYSLLYYKGNYYICKDLLKDFLEETRKVK